MIDQQWKADQEKFNKVRLLLVCILLVIWLIKNDVHTTVHIVVALTVGIRMTYKLVTVGWVSGRASSL